jgi:UDP-N-acetylglucosamine--N-acetylmuramyl-(pentapeptide) pyrophosphoryl-undecaprenol N-acetylglucosamine transferase
MAKREGAEMRILCVGGGSGGHITPGVAVVEEMQKESPDNLEIRVWVDRRFAPPTRELLQDSVKIQVIVSGKFRRYANLSLWKKIRYHIFRTYLRNFLDLFKIGFGFLQSFAKLIFWRPNVVFCKGGYVCLPVGLAARILRIPLVIHDSDTVPGLTNKILAKFASRIGTGSPVENYPNYPRKITKFVGIPVRPEFKKLSEKDKKNAKKSLGFNDDKSLIFVAGGGGGAQIFAEALPIIVPEIIKNKAQILLSAGRGKSFAPAKNLAKDFFVKEFITENYAEILNACDIFVTRAGATSLAEAASANCATIIIPSPYLAGDHQTKNAAVYANSGAAVVIDERNIEKNPEILLDEIKKLLDDESYREKLGDNLARFIKPNALLEMVKMILSEARDSRKS